MEKWLSLTVVICVWVAYAAICSKNSDIDKLKAQIEANQATYQKTFNRNEELEKTNAWQAEQLKEYFRMKETYKKEPEAVLEKLGFSYEQLTDSIIAYYDKKRKNEKPKSKPNPFDQFDKKPEITDPCALGLTKSQRLSIMKKDGPIRETGYMTYESPRHILQFTGYGDLIDCR